MAPCEVYGTDGPTSRVPGGELPGTQSAEVCKAPSSDSANGGPDTTRDCARGEMDAARARHRRLCVARYETVTSKTQRLAPPSLDSFRHTWTGRPKTASNDSF